MFQSEWDLWSYSASKDTLRCISDRQGEQRQIKLTLNKKNWDSVYVDFTNTYVSGLNKLNKSMHLFNWLEHGDHYDLIENMISPHKLVSLVWSDDHKNALLRRSKKIFKTQFRYPLRILSKRTFIGHLLSWSNGTVTIPYCSRVWCIYLKIMTRVSVTL